jgi:pseudaminic acid biosynthesis-associated methylase
MKKRLTPQLEKWNSLFGEEYSQRNKYCPEELDKVYLENYGITRTELNGKFLGEIPLNSSILEIGANVGNQLAILKKMGYTEIFAVEPQRYAVELLKKDIKDVNVSIGNIFDIPYEDACFDMVFTSGVLIHIAPTDILKALREIHRCSNKYIWGFEYYSRDYNEVEYRGNQNLLWKGDFCGMFIENFCDLEIVEKKCVKYLNSDNVDMMYLLKKK